MFRHIYFLFFGWKSSILSYLHNKILLLKRDLIWPTREANNYIHVNVSLFPSHLSSNSLPSKITTRTYVRSQTPLLSDSPRDHIPSASHFQTNAFTLLQVSAPNSFLNTICYLHSFTYINYCSFYFLIISFSVTIL